MAETPHLHSRGNPNLPFLAAAAEVPRSEFTRAEVSAAVSRQLSLPPEIEAVVGLAGRLHYIVNQQPEFLKAGLDGASFHSLLVNNLTPEIARLLDPSQAAKIRAEQEKNANITSADGARLGFQLVNGVWVRAGSDSALAMRGSGNGSSTRFDDIGTAVANQDWGSPGGQRYMSNYAIEHGVPWAANNPDLLRLGPSAIDVLAKGQLRKDVYERMVNEAGFKPKDVVTSTDWAVKHGKDANELNNSIADVNRGLPTDLMQEHNKKLMKFFTAPADQRDEALKNMDEAHQHILQRDPARLDVINREREKLGMKAFEAKKENDARVAATAGANNTLSALNAGAAPAAAPAKDAKAEASGKATPERPKAVVQQAAKLTHS